MVMVPTLTPTLVSTTDMPDTTLDTLMPTTARGPLMLSPPPLPSLRLMPTTTEPMVWATTVWATGPMELTLTLIMATTTARGPLMLSPPPLPMLMPTTTEPTVWATTVWATEDMPDTPMLIMDTTTARGPLMLSPPPLPSPMLMPTTATTAMVPGPTTATVWDTDTVWATEATGDKFSAVESTKQKLKANITPCYLT